MKRDEFVQSLKKAGHVNFPPDASGVDFYLPKAAAQAVAETLDRVLPTDEDITGLIEADDDPVVWVLVLRTDLLVLKVGIAGASLTVECEIASAEHLEPSMSFVYGMADAPREAHLRNLRIGGTSVDVDSGNKLPPVLLLRFIVALLAARGRARESKGGGR